jgi:hypothetical protein
MSPSYEDASQKRLASPPFKPLVPKADSRHQLVIGSFPLQDSTNNVRISFSILCVIICLLLIALWWRSYVADDVVAWKTKNGMTAIVAHGALVLMMFPSRVKLFRCTWNSISGAKIDAALVANAGYMDRMQGHITTLKRQIKTRDRYRNTAAIESEIKRLCIAQGSWESRCG